MSDQLRTMLDNLGAQRADLLALSAPIKAHRQKLNEQIAPLEAELRQVNALIKEIEQPHLGELLRAISGTEQALGITGLRECCRDPSKRTLAEKRGIVTVEQCSECGRLHHTIEAEPLVVGVTGAAAG